MKYNTEMRVILFYLQKTATQVQNGKSMPQSEEKNMCVEYLNACHTSL